MYAAANPVRYTPFPVFQTYNAYTPYLDKLNAGYLEDAARAPEYILMNLNNLGDTQPIIDTPALWFSVYKFYDEAAVLRTGGLPVALLKRRGRPRFNQLVLIGKKICAPGQMVQLPPTSQPVVLKISMRLGLMGRIADLLFRVPPVKFSIRTDNGRINSFTAYPATLKDGVLLSFVPATPGEAFGNLGNFLNGNRLPYRATGFSIGGDGAAYYKDEIEVEFYMVPGIELKTM